ncbi:MAG TPA: serine/threonine-protein kinase [Polyangiaceae bacterium]
MAVQNKSNVPVGTVLEGKFRITREIGRGGMAAVYEAENVDIGKRVAVKILAAELITSRVVRERFIREARAASAVRSPHICDVYDSGMYEERPFLVMELLEGESLYDMLTRLRRLDVPTALTVAVQTSRGLGKAHEANIVHRDLKPENIFVSRDEYGALNVKLLDFGLAKFYEPTNDGDPKTARLTREGALFGTPAYMSPEQAKGQGEVDLRSDLWALGCIVYECLTGQTVWSVEQGVAMILAQVASAPVPRPSRVRPDLPPGFDAWFGRALDRDPARRFQTSRELAETLEVALAPDQAPRSAIASVHTEAEGAHIDELIAHSGAARPGELGAGDILAEPDPNSDGITPEPVVRPERRSSGVWPLLLVAAVVLGGYAVWLKFLHPPGEGGKGAATPRATASASARGQKPRPPATDPDLEPFALMAREGQALFDKDPKAGIEKFKSAYALGSAAPARSLLSHASVAVEEATRGGCRVAAIARPRPFELDQAVASPVIRRTSEGVLLGWVDNHADSKKRQAHVVLLDEALRRNAEPLAVTPEASNVQDLELKVDGDKVVLLYSDEAGKQHGIFARQLGADGRIASPARRIARVKPADPGLALVPIGDGSYFAVWVEELRDGATDIMVQKLAAGLDPLGEPKRLTALVPLKGLPTRAASVDAVVARGELFVSFALELPGQREQVSLLNVPLTAIATGKGIEPVRPKKGQPHTDQVLGTLRTIAKVVGRVPQPRLSCGQEGCLVAWDEEKGGASVAFLQHGKTQPLWHRQFAEKGSRPAVLGDESGSAMAWYEDSRLRLASLGRDGLRTPSVVNRVTGFQPSPALARGAKPGEWLLAWRDYEAGHLELFALRAECP